MKGNCNHCGNEHTWGRNSSGKYCSNKCQQEAKSVRLIEKWLKTGEAPKYSPLPKKHLLSINDACWECGIKEWLGKPIALELEHIDGNGFNHHIDNLKLLCPNCHSQTPTYKNKNRGKGRLARIAQ